MTVKLKKLLKKIPREHFIPNKWQYFSYADFNIPLTQNVKMFSPELEGRILSSLQINKKDNVLEIGTGSGYLTTLLSLLAKSVLSLEIDEILYIKARENIDKFKINNIKLLCTDAINFISNDFYNVILIGGAVHNLDKKLTHWLKTGGRLLFFEAKTHCMTAKLIIRTSDDNWHTKSLFETNVDYITGGRPIKKFNF